MAEPRIAVIISSPREARFANRPAAWLRDKIGDKVRDQAKQTSS